MAFPSIRSSIVTNGTTATATPVVSLPATIRAGDTLVVYFRNAAAGAVGFPADWVELVDAAPDASGDQVAIAWKKADGTEGASITLSSGNGKFAAIARAIRDAADPLILPPQISTVAVGTTGEPNATTVTPTGGAKDYLWDTVFLMEGEQTGITANPSGYTLDQQFANSGTAGAVTTNCTIGAVARTNNAASEDAGVWDVAGTLDDSVAYTLAFHPADVVTTPLTADTPQPNALPRWSAPIVALTIAVNLLQSTLAPDAAPFSQKDWPNPPRGGRFVTVTQTLPADDADRAFAQHRWPNPPTPKPIAATWLVNLLETTLGAPPAPAPFAQTEWPLPVRPRAEAITQRTFVSYYVSDDSVPFAQTAWPVPPRPARLITSVQTLPTDDAVRAFAQYAWPNPQPLKPPARTWTVNLLESTLAPAVVQAPFAQTDWSLPTRARGTALSWSQSRPTFAVDATPLFQPIDPPTRRPAPPGATWTVSLLQSTLQGTPSGQTDWPLPRRAAPPTLTWLQTRPVFAADEAPFAQTEWPLPLRQKGTALSWLQGRPIGASDEPPVGDSDTTLPRPRVAPAHSWIQMRPVFAEDARLQGQWDWPTPTLAVKPALTWTQARPFYFAEPGSPPPGQSIANVNPTIGRANAVGWSQTRPQFYTDAGILRQSEWPLPTRPVVPALTWVQSRPFFYAEPGAPPPGQSIANVLPQVGRANAVGWLQARPALAQDGTIPRAAEWPLPTSKPRHTATWTSSTLALGEPLRPVDWPLPPRRAASLVDFVAASVRETPAPFVQADWPRPAVSARVPWSWAGTLLQSTLATNPDTAREYTLPRARPPMAQTWLQARPTFYQDAQPFAQHDWPLPRRPIVPALVWASVTVHSTLGIPPLEIDCTDVLSLMPRRDVVSLMTVRDVIPLMPRRTVVCPCCGE